MFHLMLAAKGFLVGWEFFRVDQGDWAIDFCCSTRSASEVLFDSFFERTRGSAVKFGGMEAEDVEPGGHDAGPSTLR